MKEKNPELSIILPCRNEEASLEQSILQIKKVINQYKIPAEIIVSDSSTDSSPIIAKKNKIVLVKHDKEGYGLALIEGIKQAKGEYLFIADPDSSYDFNEIPKFYKALQEGADIVIGDRFRGKMEKKAMPFLHKYIGNPVLSLLARIFFNIKIRDSQCGMRAFTKKAYQELQLQTTGMEFASEMLMKASKKNLKIKEIPISYHPRAGHSKLRTFSDGWRHLRFMLIYSPFFLFFLPGLALFLLGSITFILLYFNLLTLWTIKLYYHPLFISSGLIIAGYQIIIFALFAKSYAHTHFQEPSKTISKISRIFSLEKIILIGILIFLSGIIIYLLITIQWIRSGFGELQAVKQAILALTLCIIGIQTCFSAFMLSILSIKNK